ncbi:MAG: GNAT family N-acetyltransferase [Pseudomonadales bacterium]|nr:GNAT family N-acetyltransferase [Pseudomonadales bacterium]
MDAPRITTATSEDRERVLSAIVMGFSSDPLIRWFWPEANQYLAAAGLVFDAVGGGAIDAGTAFVTEGFEGAALWLPPGVTSNEEAIMACMEATASADIIKEIVQVFEEIDKYHPEEDIWYLPLIAIDPVHQGRGFGSALMKEALLRCDEAGLPAYLESSNPRNISIYERHGFEVMGEVQVGSSPVVTPMLRPAR